MIYFGTIDHISSMTDNWMLVIFDDGDEEDFDKDWILQGLELYKKCKHLDPCSIVSTLKEKEYTLSSTLTTTTTELIMGGKSDDNKIQMKPRKKMSTSFFLPQ